MARDPATCLETFLRLHALETPGVDAARRVRAAELRRAVDELFSAVYCDLQLSPREADAFVWQHELVEHMTAAVARPLPWPHRLGIIDHGVGLLDNYFARKANYEAQKHRRLLAVMMQTLQELLEADIAAEFQVELEGALESVLLLLGRLLARAPEQLAEAAAIDLARTLARILMDARYERYVGHASLHPLQQLLCNPGVGSDVRGALLAVEGVEEALRCLAADRQRLSYGLVHRAQACLAALRDDGSSLAKLFESEVFREELFLPSSASSALPRLVQVSEGGQSRSEALPDFDETSRSSSESETATKDEEAGDGEVALGRSEPRSDSEAPSASPSRSEIEAGDEGGAPTPMPTTPGSSRGSSDEVESSFVLPTAELDAGADAAGRAKRSVWQWLFRP